MLTGAIFDMDGVLLNNLEYHLEAFQLLGLEEQREWGRQEILATFGRRNRDMLESLFGAPLSPQKLKRLAARKEELYRRRIADELGETMVPGLPEFLKDLRDAKIAIALATSGPPENVNLVLEGLRIRGFFRSVVTGEEVRNGKPDPEIFLLAAQRLGQVAGDCVVFEDSESGIRAALRAGCRCAALATTHRRGELQQLAPHLILDDFTGITTEILRRRIG